MKPRSRIFTTAVHAGEDLESAQGSLSFPVYLSGAFALPDAARGADIHEGLAPGYFYGRMGTPTQSALEQAVCQLEEGESALALASGMAAISTAVLSLVTAGDHVVVPQATYATTGVLFDEVLAPLGIKVTSVDATKPRSYEEVVNDHTRLLYIETPSNPTLQLTDIEKVVEIAHRWGITTLVDNTFATPVNQRPLELGADLVVHSATKYLGGHSDLVAGVLVGRGELVERARWHTAKILGGTISPLTAWLVLRGLRTLALRVTRHNESASTVARYLAGHGKVRAVHYPGLESSPQHALARRQMSGFGGIVSFDLGDRAAGRRFVDSLRLCTLAVSLGDTATLVQHSASMTHASASSERRRCGGVGEGLVRVSVGLEDVEDIIADLEQGLTAV